MKITRFTDFSIKELELLELATNRLEVIISDRAVALAEDLNRESLVKDLKNKARKLLELKYEIQDELNNKGVSTLF